MKIWIRKSKMLIFPAALLCLFMLTVSPAFAMVIENGLNFDEDLNGGAFITNSTLPPEDAAYRDIVEHHSNTDGWAYSGPIPLSEIPVFNIGALGYYVFSYDTQENAADPEITIENIELKIGDLPIWSLEKSITLNPNDGIYKGDDTNAYYTSTYLSAGGDLELYIPVSLFSEYYVGDYSLIFRSNVTSNDNGHEKWIMMAPVPIPGAVWLLGSGIVGIVGIRRRYRK